MYYVVLRRYYVDVPKCSKLAKKVQKIHEITFQIKICVERVICQDIAVFFSKVKKYPNIFWNFSNLGEASKGPVEQWWKNFIKTLIFLLLKPTVQCLVKLHFLQKYFFRKKQRKKWFHEFFALFCELSSTLVVVILLKRQESVCMCCWISKRCLIALSIPEADLCFSSLYVLLVVLLALLPFRMLTRSTPQWTLIGQSGVEADWGSYKVIELTFWPLGRPGSTFGKEIAMKTVMLEHDGLCPGPKKSA